MGNMNEFIAGWMAHRKVLPELLNTLQDKDISFRPWENAMSVADLTLHITGSMNHFAKMVKNDGDEPFPTPERIETISDLKGIVEERTEKTKAVLESLTDEQLSATVEFAGRKMPGIALLEMGKEHEIHHKGQLFTYARIAGAEKLPMFVGR